MKRMKSRVVGDTSVIKVRKMSVRKKRRSFVLCVVFISRKLQDSNVISRFLTDFRPSHSTEYEFQRPCTITTQRKLL